MIAQVLSVKVGTKIKTPKSVRVFSPAMLTLIGEYVHLEEDEKNKDWFAMVDELDEYKYVFHKDWLEFDIPEETKSKIDFPEGMFKDVRMDGGLIPPEGLERIQDRIERFSAVENSSSTRIIWPNLCSMANSDPSWYIYHKDSRPIDQRYRQFTIDRYGVQVPDKVVEMISATAKEVMTTQSKTEICVEKDSQGVVRIKKIEPVTDEIIGIVSQYRGWLLVSSTGRGGKYPVIPASIVVNILGREKYASTNIKFTDVDARLACIYNLKERKPLINLAYAKESE